MSENGIYGFKFEFLNYFLMHYILLKLIENSYTLFFELPVHNICLS